MKNNKAYEAQRELCSKHGYPFFASFEKCPCCGKEIYGEKGYDVEKASKEYITGCPFCHISFCD